MSLIAALQFAIAPARAHPVAEEMAAAANKFLASLDAAQKAKAQFDFKAEDRLDWHYIPKERKGLTIREMSAGQRKLVHALLLTGYSQHGYNKATNVISLEPVLHELEGAGRRFPMRWRRPRSAGCWAPAPPRASASSRWGRPTSRW